MPSMGGSHIGTRYGDGTYLAVHASKADSYTDDFFQEEHTMCVKKVPGSRDTSLLFVHSSGIVTGLSSMIQLGITQNMRGRTQMAAFTIPFSHRVGSQVLIILK